MQALSTLFNKITPALTNAMAPQQDAGSHLPPGFQPVRPAGAVPPPPPPAAAAAAAAPVHRPLQLQVPVPVQPQVPMQPTTQFMSSQRPMQMQMQSQFGGGQFSGSMPYAAPQAGYAQAQRNQGNMFHASAPAPALTPTPTHRIDARQMQSTHGLSTNVHANANINANANTNAHVHPSANNMSSNTNTNANATGAVTVGVAAGAGVSQPSFRPQTMRPPGVGSVHVGSTIPNLSHLTDEERRKIESVIRRHREEEEKDFRKLTSRRASTKVFPLFSSVRRSSVHATMLCGLCRRTQFVGDSGNTCHFCGIKTCMRCGVRTNANNVQAVWMCNGCRQMQAPQSQWPAADGNYYGTIDGSGVQTTLNRRQGGPTANGPTSNPGFTIRRQMPVVNVYDNSASSFHNPNSNSSQLQNPNVNPSPNQNSNPNPNQHHSSYAADMYAPRRTVQSTIPREVSTGSSTFVSSPDVEYGERASRYSQKAAADNYTHYGSSQTSRQPLSRNRHLPSAPFVRPAPTVTKPGRQRTYSLGSCSSVEELTTTECTSCDEIGETDSILSDQNYRSIYFNSSKESALESVEYHRRAPCLVTWQRSGDGSRLIGHMVLKKSIPTHELVAAGVSDSNGLGLKVVGGRMTESGVLGAFVTMITSGGIADMIGRLRVGDQILEWNNQSLQHLSLDEVYQVILGSKDQPQVEIIAQRMLPAALERAFSVNERIERSSSVNHVHRFNHRRNPEATSQLHSDSMSVIENTSGRYDDMCPVHEADQSGRIKIRLWQDENNGYLIVTILSASLRRPARNSYCILRVVPQRGDVTVRKSKVASRSSSNARMNDIRWNQTFVFPALPLNLSDTVFLEVSIYDAANDCVIGQTELQLCDALLSDEAAWYTLYRLLEDKNKHRTASSHRNRSDSTYSDEAVYLDDARNDVNRSLTAPSRQHNRSHSPRRNAGTAEFESSEYESDTQRAKSQSTGRSARRSPSPRRTNNNSHVNSSPRNHSAVSSNASSKRSAKEQQSNVDIYARYQQLIEQSKRERQPRTSRSRRHSSHASPTRAQAENNVVSDASESGVSESPQPSVQSVGRSKRPTTLPMRLLSDVSEDTHSKDDSLRTVEAPAETQKQLRRGSRLPSERKDGEQHGRRKSRPYARSVSAESPDAIDEPSAAAADECAATKDGNASDSGVATGSATSGNANGTATADSNRKVQLSTNNADEKSAASKSLVRQNASNGQATATASAQRDDADDPPARKEGFNKKASVIKSGNRSASSSNLIDKKNPFTRSEEVGRAAQMRAAGASKPDLSDFGFIDGLGPGQIVGRQALGATCLGEIQISLLDRKGSLEAEVIRCRNLAVPKSVGKTLPACYVKLYLMDNKHCLEKQRTNICQKRSLEPVYQQKFSFTEVYKERSLQVMIWGDYARTDRKVFMGVAQISLGALDLKKCVIGWYKLYPANSIVGGIAE